MRYSTANQQDFVEFSPCTSSKPCTKHDLAMEWSQVMPVGRIGLVLLRVALLQPITAQTTVSMDLRQNGRPFGTLWLKKWQDGLTCIKSKNHIEYTPPCINHVAYAPPWILQPRQSLQRWERDGMMSVRLWVEIHLHHRPAVA